MSRPIFFSLLAVSCLSAACGAERAKYNYLSDFTNLSCEEGEACGLTGSAFAVADTPFDVADYIRETSAVDKRSSSLAAGDIDGDGDLDLVALNSYVFELNTYTNNGAGKFNFKETIALTGQYSFIYDLVVTDLDNDGDADIAVTWEGESAIDDLAGIEVFSNNGEGQFEFQGSTELRGNALSDLSVADLNGDGLLDSVVSDFTNRIQLFVNNGTGGFVTQALPQDGVTHVTLGDFDGDQDVDIAGSQFINEVTAHFSNVLLYENDGAGQFTPKATIPVPNATPSSKINDLVRADFDGDGDLDLVATDVSSSSVNLLLNDGSGALGNPTNYDTQGVAFIADEMTIGDFDLDGDIDIAFEEHTSTLNVLVNDGNGDLSEQVSFTGLEVTTRPVTGDFNGDGRLDLVIANDDGSAGFIEAFLSGAPQ
jgi:hypothetical protein